MPIQFQYSQYELYLNTCQILLPQNDENWPNQPKRSTGFDRQVGDKRAATSSHAKIGRNGRDEREEATTRGMKLAAAIHACKIRGNSRSRHSTGAIEATTVKNDSIVARFYESLLKPVITSRAAICLLHATNPRWFTAQFYELIFHKTDVSISLKRVPGARYESTYYS